MIKFIYPITSEVNKKRSAWSRVRKLEDGYGVGFIKPRVREETFEYDTIFRDHAGSAYQERCRVFTFTFFLEDEDASRFVSQLCTAQAKLARVLHNNVVLLCIDDELAFRAA